MLIRGYLNPIETEGIPRRERAKSQAAETVSRDVNPVTLKRNGSI